MTKSHITLDFDNKTLNLTRAKTPREIYIFHNQIHLYWFYSQYLLATHNCMLNTSTRPFFGYEELHSKEKHLCCVHNSIQTQYQGNMSLSRLFQVG